MKKDPMHIKPTPPLPPPKKMARGVEINYSIMFENVV